MQLLLTRVQSTSNDTQERFSDLFFAFGQVESGQEKIYDIADWSFPTQDLVWYSDEVFEPMTNEDLDGQEVRPVHEEEFLEIKEADSKLLEQEICAENSSHSRFCVLPDDEAWAYRTGGAKYMHSILARGSPKVFGAQIGNKDHPESWAFCIWFPSIGEDVLKICRMRCHTKEQFKALAAAATSEAQW